MANSEKHYMGRPCKWGHTGLRWTSTAHCVECGRRRGKDRYDEETNWRRDAERVLRNRRNAARISGVEFTLSFDDIGPPPRECPVLGIPLEFGRGYAARNASPSLDRIDPSRGYVRGNVLWVSYRANRIKNDATPEELRRVAAFYT